MGKTDSITKKKKKSTLKCRCCSKALHDNYHFIYDDEGKKLNIEFLLLDSIGLRTNESDGSTQAICEPCLKQVYQTYEFKQRCLNATTEESGEDEDNVSVDEEPTEEVIEEMLPNICNEEIIDDYEPDAYEALKLGKDPLTLQNDNEYDANSVGNDDLEDNDMFYLEEEYLDDQAVEVGERQTLTEDDRSEINENDENDIEKRELKIFNAAGMELAKVKEQIRSGIPRHIIKNKSSVTRSADNQNSDDKTKLRSRKTCAKDNPNFEVEKMKPCLNKSDRAENQNLDVEKIMTSDDLMNILEDNYQNESDTDFELPNMDQYLNDNPKTNIDDYLNSIITPVYSDYESFETPIECIICLEKLTTHLGLIFHMSHSHKTGDNTCPCVFNLDCEVTGNSEDIASHIFSVHFDQLPTRIWLTCQTCENSFQSAVQFGKHMCIKPQIIEVGEEQYECLTCYKKLTSKLRFLFHKQFHLENPRPKVCIICEIEFSAEEDFYNHVMFSHEKVFEHFCDQCDKSYSANTYLDRHLKTHTAQQCTQCNLVVANKQLLDTHVSSQHSNNDNEKNLKCHVCGKVFARTSRYRKHLTIHETIDPNDVITCEKCMIVFRDEDMAAEHCQMRHDGSSECIREQSLSEALCCEFCETAFYTVKALMKHRKIHKGNVPFECDSCTSRYDSFSKLKTHKHSHINQNVAFPVLRKYVCNVPACLKAYRHWGDLTSHRKTVHLINPSILKCNECGKTFYQSWKLDYHNKTAHGKPMECNICKIVLPTEISHRIHMRKHRRGVINDNNEPVEDNDNAEKGKKKRKRKAAHDIDDYLRKENDKLVCTACGKIMLSRNNARSHIEIVHLKVRNFKCETCSREFYLRKDYTDHIRMHTSEAPFKCKEPACGKSFRTSSLYSEHRKSHSDNRPHKCSYCNASFKRLYVLKTHTKQHLGIKGYSCSHENCFREYRTQWELNYHIRKKHSNETENAYTQQNNPLTNYEAEYTNASPSEEPSTQMKSVKKRSIKLKKQQKKPKIIYVLPGPVTEKETKVHNEDIDLDRNIEHNYQAKQTVIDLEASKNPKFVYYLGDPQPKSRKIKTPEIIADGLTDSQESQLAFAQPFDLIEIDTGVDSVEYLFDV